MQSGEHEKGVQTLTFYVISLQKVIYSLLQSLKEWIKCKEK
jgi:hypothetical protein